MAEKYTGIAAGKSIKASDVETALDSKVSLSGAETITGVKTFGTASVAADPVLGKAKTAAAANDGTKFATEAQVYAHTANTSNPHGVTAAQVGARPASWTPGKADVGLGNVDNTSDANKPISTAVSTAFANLSFFPAGTILTFSTAAWNATSAAFKTVWKICNGQNGTPDLVNKFLRGGAASGAEYTNPTTTNTQTITVPVPYHNHTASSRVWVWDKSGSRSKSTLETNPHDGIDSEEEGCGRASQSFYSDDCIETTVNYAGTSGASISVNTMPSYYTVIYIMKVA